MQPPIAFLAALAAWAGCGEPARAPAQPRAPLGSTHVAPPGTMPRDPQPPRVLASPAAGDEHATGSPRAPWIEARRGRVEVTWERRGSGAVRGRATIHGPRLRILRPSSDPGAPGAGPPPGTGEVVREAAPFALDVEAVEIHDGAIELVDLAADERVRLRIHDLALAIEGFSTRRAASRGVPAQVTARGRIGRDGRIAMFLTANPWTGSLDLACRVQITDLRLAEISALVEQRADIRPTGGRITVFIELSVHAGRITGLVKPFVTGPTIAPGGPGFFAELKAWFVRGVIEFLGREVRGRERLATAIPIRGTLRRPDPELWTALLELIGNAFVEALAAGYGR